MAGASWMEWAALLLKWAGVATIIAGALLALLLFLLDLRSSPMDRAYERFRANLGRGILLGLEFLVGADIIATVTSPLSWDSVGLLGAIVLIRTILSFSLETEIEGVAPWRRGDARGESSGGTGAKTLDRDAEPPIPNHGGSSGGDMRREVGTIDEENMADGSDPQPTSVTRAMKPDDRDVPDLPNRQGGDGEGKVPPRRT